MISLNARIKIDRLGQKGEGLGRGPDGQVAVPYALAGETIIAELDGAQGKLIEVLTPSPDRIEPFCRYFASCGGCAVQTLAPAPTAQWKRELLSDALRQAGLNASVDPPIDAHGEGRRRATFHARTGADGRTAVGFMQSRAHDIVEITECPLLAPAMSGALPAARALADALAASGKPLDIHVTATAAGLDIDLRGCGALDEHQTKRLVRRALSLDLARLSNHGALITVQRQPLLEMGRALVAPPPGVFLQATEAAEKLLAEKICAALEGVETVADLFAGVGTFSLPIAEFARVCAFDLEAPALAALARGARASGLRPVKTETRDLFRRPLAPKDLAAYGAVVLDPPRAGAQEQARALAESGAPLVISVSCNIRTFARDAAILCAGGYEIVRIQPIDQFRCSPHLEIIGEFRRPAVKARRRPLLG
ncbi:class I SAM-dependent RNA methyltransferase [Methylocapsa palsarum]|uniref:23S rRNA (Uracil1939-C5)-methyltransferase n=1 Tax=Methylocapsa palsarum TaxID=1612308 RepID=A0A1I3WS97_9HYPH|nr:class I SAM-dependent RNA methyltransferase [Methylocapsa palsarum]SFK10352.1 23S rRNA (uracil1939-C5)-methyltransferase [Methylocapsa palsarum]